jgi:AhpD family alkylhydroperoxidase
MVTARRIVPINKSVLLQHQERRNRKQLAGGIKEIGQLSPDTIRGYIELSSAGQKSNLLGAKTRELIALAVAVTLRCDGCITVHTEAAIKHGATKEEIAEALGGHHGQCGRRAGLFHACDGCLQGISACRVATAKLQASRYRVRAIEFSAFSRTVI